MWLTKHGYLGGDEKNTLQYSVYCVFLRLKTFNKNTENWSYINRFFVKIK